MATLGPVFNMFFICSLILLLFVANSHSSAHKPINLRSESVSSSTILDKRIEGRTLRAAKLKSNIESRGINELLRREHKLHYLDDSPLRSTYQLSAQLRLTAIRPTLVLEELDDQLDEVTCYDTSIDLGFVSEDILRLAYKEFAGADQFLLITSHESCNYDGERDVYLVSEVSIDEISRSMILTVTRQRWRNAFQSLTVDFGSSSSSFEVRRHAGLRKRQDSDPSTTSTSDVSAASSTISFPIPPSSIATPNVHDAHGDIGKQFLNQPILPPSLPGINGVTLHGPLIPQGLTVSCKNCTTQGTIDLIEGSFTLNTNDSSSEFEDIQLFFESGYVELLVNDFSAHIELESTIQPSTSLTIYTAPLPEIGIPGFQIPGVGIVGPIFKPLITFGIQVGAVFDVTYGFDVMVPNNSSIIVDIANVTNSSVTGFPDTTITAIPFQASLDNITLTLSTGFTPELLLGISVFDGYGEAGAGVFLDLPTIKATVSQVAHVDSDCNPVDDSSSKGNHILEDLFDSLTNIVPEVDFDLGLIAQAEVHVGVVKLDKIDKFTVASTHLTLPTACLSFDAHAKTFGAPVTTPTGKDGKIKEKSAAAGIVSPFVGSLQVMVWVLASIFGCFLGL